MEDKDEDKDSPPPPLEQEVKMGGDGEGANPADNHRTNDNGSSSSGVFTQNDEGERSDSAVSFLSAAQHAYSMAAQELGGQNPHGEGVDGATPKGKHKRTLVATEVKEEGEGAAGGRGSDIKTAEGGVFSRNFPAVTMMDIALRTLTKPDDQSLPAQGRKSRRASLSSVETVSIRNYRALSLGIPVETEEEKKQRFSRSFHTNNVESPSPSTSSNLLQQPVQKEDDPDIIALGYSTTKDYLCKFRISGSKVQCPLKDCNRPCDMRIDNLKTHILTVHYGTKLAGLIAKERASGKPVGRPRSIFSAPGPSSQQDQAHSSTAATTSRPLSNPAKKNKSLLRGRPPILWSCRICSTNSNENVFTGKKEALLHVDEAHGVEKYASRLRAIEKFNAHKPSPLKSRLRSSRSPKRLRSRSSPMNQQLRTRSSPTQPRIRRSPEELKMTIILPPKQLKTLPPKQMRSQQSPKQLKTLVPKQLRSQNSQKQLKILPPKQLQSQNSQKQLRSQQYPPKVETNTKNIEEPRVTKRSTRSTAGNISGNDARFYNSKSNAKPSLFLDDILVLEGGSMEDSVYWICRLCPVNESLYYSRRSRASLHVRQHHNRRSVRDRDVEMIVISNSQQRQPKGSGNHISITVNNANKDQKIFNRAGNQKTNGRSVADLAENKFRGMPKLTPQVDLHSESFEGEDDDPSEYETDDDASENEDVSDSDNEMEESESASENDMEDDTYSYIEEEEDVSDMEMDVPVSENEKENDASEMEKDPTENQTQNDTSTTEKKNNPLTSKEQENFRRNLCFMDIDTSNPFNTLLAAASLEFEKENRGFEEPKKILFDAAQALPVSIPLSSLPSKGRGYFEKESQNAEDNVSKNGNTTDQVVADVTIHPEIVKNRSDTITNGQTTDQNNIVNGEENIPPNQEQIAPNHTEKNGKTTDTIQTPMEVREGPLDLSVITIPTMNLNSSGRNKDTGPSCVRVPVIVYSTKKPRKTFQFVQSKVVELVTLSDDEDADNEISQQQQVSVLTVAGPSSSSSASDPPPPTVCPICSESFPLRPSFIEHLKIHEESEGVISIAQDDQQFEATVEELEQLLTGKGT